VSLPRNVPPRQFLDEVKRGVPPASVRKTDDPSCASPVESKPDRRMSLRNQGAAMRAAGRECRGLTVGRGVRHHRVGGTEARTYRACAFGRWKSGFLVLRIACWRAWKQSIPVALDHPEPFGHASANCGRGRRAHNRRAVTCHLQRSPVSALPETPDWTCLHPWSYAERRPRLRLEGWATNSGNAEGDASIGHRRRTDDFASRSTPVACFGQRVGSLTHLVPARSGQRRVIDA
jgi:hypothetical protein